MDQNRKNRVIVFVLLALIPLAAIGIYVEEHFTEPKAISEQAAVLLDPESPVTAALPEISERTAFEMCAAVMLAADAYPTDVPGHRDGNQWRFNWTVKSPVRTSSALGAGAEPGSCVAQDDGQVSSVRIGDRVIR
jgi:hypothetical protein